MNNTNSSAQIYDFVHPEHKINSTWPVLNIVSKRVAKEFSESLNAVFQLPLEVLAEPISFNKYEDFIGDIAETDLLYEIVLAPMPGVAWLSIDRSLIYSLVDTYFGGKGSSTDADQSRPLSQTEVRVCQKFIDSLQLALTQGWSMTVHVEKPTIVQIQAERMPHTINDHVVVCCENIFVLSEKNYSVKLVYSHSMLEPYREQLSKVKRVEGIRNDQFNVALKQELMHCEVDMQAVLAEARITVAQLLDLKAGDFIPLRDIETVSFRANSTHLFDAKVGISNGQVSAKISRWCLADNS